MKINYYNYKVNFRITVILHITKKLGHEIVDLFKNNSQ